MNALSVIICKHNSEVFEKCLDSIKSTLNIPYELIVIDNTDNSYNIFTAYNEGIKRSSGDVLCFMHEDIICHEPSWGQMVIAHFENDLDLGMIGVAGGASFHKFAWSWNQTYFKNDFAISLASTTTTGLTHTKNGFDTDSKQVLIVDGLWFCIKRKVLDVHAIRFDSETFKGFHRYDYDISMQIAQVAKIKVINNILLEHLSSGNRDQHWMQANIDFQSKWSSYFPCTVMEGKIGIHKLKITSKDTNAFYSFIHIMGTMGFSNTQIRHLIKDQMFELKGKWITQLKLTILYVIGFNGFMKIKRLL